MKARVLIVAASAACLALATAMAVAQTESDQAKAAAKAAASETGSMVKDTAKETAGTAKDVARQTTATAKGAVSAKAAIATATQAGPKSITAKATVKDMAGNVLRQGSNAWICWPGPKVTSSAGAMCGDATWEKWMSAYMMAKSDFRADRVAIAYMLAGDEGGSLSDPFAAKPTKDWVVEGPHLMILLPDAKLLDAFSTDPKNGGAYVMWKGTPYAHLMVPVDKKH